MAKKKKSKAKPSLIKKLNRIVAEERKKKGLGPFKDHAALGFNNKEA